MTRRAGAAPRCIALLGLPGAGKSEVAVALAARLGWQVVDTDHAGDGAGAWGEVAMRRALDPGPPCVVACGGEPPLEGAIRQRLARETLSIWLDAPDSVLLARLAADPARPLLRGDARASLAQLRARDTPAYGGAHLRLRTDDRSPAEVAAHLAQMVLRTVSVAAEPRRYHVLVGSGAGLDLPDHLPPEAGMVALVADHHVVALARRLASAVRRSGRQAAVLTITGGERVKTWVSAGRLHERLIRMGLGRRDCVVAVGGGTVGDLAGLVAATYHRGVAIIHVPTTLQAMVDSAIGGKTGVNLPSGKNLVGSVWPPRAVLCDPGVLATLPARELRAALGEVIKYAMIAGGALLDLLDHSLEAILGGDLDVLTAVILESVAIKAGVVSEDEFEAGRRAILNYGHTAGHALEAAAGYGTVLHGEAVAVGLRVSGLLSMAELDCPAGDVAWQDEIVGRCGLGVPPPLPASAVLARLGFDKKAVAGENRWVLLRRLADPVWGVRVDEVLVRQTLDRVFVA